ncbi:MAG: invasion associated locus B family protein [Phyllobacterium sp.]
MGNTSFQHSLRQAAVFLGGAVFLAASAISSNAQDSASLPGGATSLQESHGDWSVVCAVQAQGEQKAKLCALTQQQTDQNSRQRVLTVELRPVGDAVEGVLILPFGLALAKGAALQIDEQPAAEPSPFRTCLPSGCIVDVSLDAKTLAVLKKGTTLKLNVVADGGKETQLGIPLNGFAAAVDRTKALLN